MRYRKYNRRRPRRRRSSAEEEDIPQLGLVEDVLDLLVSAFIALIKAIFRCLSTRWRGASVRPSTTHRSSGFPSSSKPYAPGQRFTKAQSRELKRQRAAFVVPPYPEPRRISADPLPYQRTPHLLSPGERAVWHPIYLAVRGKYRLFCKVRLYDVVHCPPEHPEEGQWFEKIRGYHVDFLITDPDTTCPLLVIEHDDGSHRNPEQQQRDAFKDAVLKAAGVPIYRIRAQQAYDPAAIACQIELFIAKHPPQ